MSELSVSLASDGLRWSIERHVKMGDCLFKHSRHANLKFYNILQLSEEPLPKADKVDLNKLSIECHVKMSDWLFKHSRHAQFKIV